uniref:Uncharacterized protein n=1 Tax=Marseillevirus LCMAC201 TaxID=2506605 RepID=A0A481YXT4_9VIRU|nr:MAG: hypothetical protein LCMAC201_02640 [Marseillevirus LCMAC201]
MVKHTTIALIQSIFALIVLVINASLQVTGLVHLNQTTLDNQDIKDAKNFLLGAVIAQFIAIILMITVSILIIIYKAKLQLYMSKLLYTALVISGLLMLVSGSLGANAAVRLQCYKNDFYVKKAWEMSSISAILGIGGTFILLLIQAFIKRDTIKDIAREYLTTKVVKKQVPTYFPVRHRAPMPLHNPVPYRKNTDVSM